MKLFQNVTFSLSQICFRAIFALRQIVACKSVLEKVLKRLYFSLFSNETLSDFTCQDLRFLFKGCLWQWQIWVTKLLQGQTIHCR